MVVGERERERVNYCGGGRGVITVSSRRGARDNGVKAAVVGYRAAPGQGQ